MKNDFDLHVMVNNDVYSYGRHIGTLKPYGEFYSDKHSRFDYLFKILLTPMVDPNDEMPVVEELRDLIIEQYKQVDQVAVVKYEFSRIYDRWYIRVYLMRKDVNNDIKHGNFNNAITDLHRDIV